MLRPCGSAALALLIVALAAAVCLLSRRATRGIGRLLPVALVLLIAAGTLGAIDPWGNDWLFVSVRSTTGRGAPMPLATSSRIYESPDFGPLVHGPFTETFEEITVAPAGTAGVGSAGASLLFVLDGQVEVQPALGSSTKIATRGATLLPPAASAQLSNVGDRPAHVLEVTVVQAPTG